MHVSQWDLVLDVVDFHQGAHACIQNLGQETEGHCVPDASAYPLQLLTPCPSLATTHMSDTVIQLCLVGTLYKCILFVSGFSVLFMQDLAKSSRSQQQHLLQLTVRVTRLCVACDQIWLVFIVYELRNFFLKQKKRRNCQEKRSRKLCDRDWMGPEKLKIFTVQAICRSFIAAAVQYSVIKCAQSSCVHPPVGYTLDHFLVWAVLNSAVRTILIQVPWGT